MRILSSIFNFYINASIHVALAVVSLVVIFQEIWIGSTDLIQLFYVFCATITGYNFIKYAKVAGLHHRSLVGSMKAIQLFSFLAFCGLIYSIIQLPIKLWIVSSVLGVMTLLYALPFLGRRNLRTLAGIKIFVVGIVWAGVAVFVPWSTSSLKIDMDVWLSCFQCFLLVVVWTLPFEIRDLAFDAKSLRTLPQIFGVEKVKGVGIGMLVAVILMEGLKDELPAAQFTSLMLVCLLSAIALIMAQKKQPKYYSSFWVESIPIVWGFLFFVLKELFR